MPTFQTYCTFRSDRSSFDSCQHEALQIMHTQQDFCVIVYSNNFFYPAYEIFETMLTIEVKNDSAVNDYMYLG